jgi:predicted ATPase/DNA-binding SARP family transcriptional activator
MDTQPAARLLLLGSPVVLHGGVSLALPFERRTQVAVLLALRRSWVPRAELAALLWPEQPAAQAFTNLRKALFRLQGLPWAAAIESQGAALRFLVETDVQGFDAAVRAQQLPQALGAYRGELLAGFDDGQGEAWTQWLRFERERLRVAWRGAALAQLANEPGGVEAAALSARLLEADPLDEAALRAHMAALVANGQAAAARQAWQRFVDTLGQELGLEPSAELLALQAALSQGAGVGAPPAAMPTPVPMPAVDEGFVGRSIELRRIADLLARPECRLLCLVGPGGVGKTRLAQRAGSEQAPSYSHGAVVVMLEGVDTPAQFGVRLAEAAGLAGAARQRGAGDALAQAVAAWRDRHMLLVLDNFEPLAEHAALLLGPLLQGCAALKILVTSRVRLTVAEEWSMPLEGLPCPDWEDEDHAESFDAVRLFVNKAMRTAPEFSPAAERAAIVDICRQVEGLPLALELAAAWVRVLPCSAIASELRRGTELLQARDAARPPRHASIEVVFEHSWSRLSAAERQVLARLSVFQGGFTVAAARAVTGASLPVLAALADKSLLARSDRRMRLHPLVQQLAGLRLAGLPPGGGEEQRATEAAHADYFMRWLERLNPAVEDGKRVALEPMDDDFENCRQAWRTLTRDGHAAALMRNARTLLTHWDHRGRAEEGLAWLSETIASPLGQADAALRTLLLGQAAHLEYRMGRYEQARAHATAALSAANPRQDHHGARMQSLTVLASCALQQGRLLEARRCYKQALALASPQTRAHNTAATLDNLALVEKRLGHYEESLRLSTESLAQHRLIGDLAGVALCLNNLANMHLLTQDYDQAQAHLLEALAICDSEGLPSTRTYVLSSLTEVAMKTGDQAASERYAARAVDAADSTGNRPVACWMSLQLVRMAVRRGDLADARDKLAIGAGAAIALGMPSLHAGVLLAFAELLDAQDEPASARRVLAFAVDHPSITPADRDELRAEWARRAAQAQPDPAWPGMALDELLRRIANEAETVHAGLLGALQASTTAHTPAPLEGERDARHHRA